MPWLNNTTATDGFIPGGISARGAAVGFIACLIMLVIVLGNATVVLVVSSNKKLQTRTNCFIVSLAVADFCVGMFVMPPALLLELTGGYWPWSDTVCTSWVSLDVMCSTASILNLCVVGLDRLMAITSPFSYDTKRSAARTVMMLSSVWLGSALISFLPISLGWYKSPDYTPSPHQCLFIPNVPYAILSSCVSFYIPLVVMVCTYYSIFRAAQRQSRQVSSLDASNFQMGINVISVKVGDELRESDRRKLATILARERKAFKSLGIIMAVFVLCWFPFFVCNVVAPVCMGCVSPLLASTVTWLGWVNSVFNPIIYAFLNRDFRKAAVILVTCRRCRQIAADRQVMPTSDLETAAHSKPTHTQK